MTTLDSTTRDDPPTDAGLLGSLGTATVAERRPSSAAPRAVLVGLRVLLRTALLAVLGVVLAALVVILVLPRITQGAAMTVLTGSMEPTIPTGSVVMVRPVDPGTLEVGDIATYQKKEAEDTYITHRITDVDTSGRQTRFIFKGDANRGPDLRPVPASAIRGEVWFHVPYLGSIRNVAAGPAGLGLLAMLLLAGYAALQVVGVLRDRRRAGDGTTAPIAAEVADARALVLVELATRELPNLDASEAARRLNGLAVREDADTCTVLISREQPPATQQTTDLVVARLGVAPLSQLSVDARGTLTLRVADLCAPGGDAGSAAPEKGQDRAEA